MKNLNKEIGSFGESLAINFLTTNGFKVLDKNFRCRIGELDIICKDNNTLCFTEVKTRYFNSYGAPLESVTLKKQRNIYKLAQLYCMKNKISNVFIRFDVVEIILYIDSTDFTVNLIKSAF